MFSHRTLGWPLAQETNVTCLNPVIRPGQTLGLVYFIVLLIAKVVLWIVLLFVVIFYVYLLSTWYGLSLRVISSVISSSFSPHPLYRCGNFSCKRSLEAHAKLSGVGTARPLGYSV